MDLVYPSDLFPPPPSLRLQVPEGWRTFQQPDVTMGAADPQSPQPFTTNVVVTVARVLGEVDLDSLVEAQLSESTGPLGGVLADQQREEVAGRDAIWTTVTYTKDDLPVIIFQAAVTLLVARGDDIADLVTVTASCDATHADHYSQQFRAVFLSLAVGE